MIRNQAENTRDDRNQQRRFEYARVYGNEKKKNGGRTHPAEHGHFVAEATAVGDALIPPVQHEPAR